MSFNYLGISIRYPSCAMLCLRLMQLYLPELFGWWRIHVYYKCSYRQKFATKTPFRVDIILRIPDMRIFETSWNLMITKIRVCSAVCDPGFVLEFKLSLTALVKRSSHKYCIFWLSRHTKNCQGYIEFQSSMIS